MNRKPIPYLDYRIDLYIYCFDSLKSFLWLLFIFICIYLKKRFYLLGKQRERQRHRQREKQAPHREPHAGLDPGSLWSCPGPKVAPNRWATRAAQKSITLSEGFYFISLISWKKTLLVFISQFYAKTNKNILWLSKMSHRNIWQNWTTMRVKNPQQQNITFFG